MTRFGVGRNEVIKKASRRIRMVRARSKDLGRRIRRRERGIRILDEE